LYFLHQFYFKFATIKNKFPDINCYCSCPEILLFLPIKAISGNISERTEDIIVVVSNVFYFIFLVTINLVVIAFKDPFKLLFFCSLVRDETSSHDWHHFSRTVSVATIFYPWFQNNSQTNKRRKNNNTFMLESLKAATKKVTGAMVIC
jgi:hypothetical protein